MKAHLPDNEKQRLEALRNFEILDSQPEESYDQITSLASRICGAETALITFVDRDRQWFKSKVGIEGCETSRDVAFCSHTILHEDVFVVEDASKHPDFKDNPLVIGDPSIRFYAGAPLVDSEGYALGSVCVISDKPRTISENQKQSLKDLAKLTMAFLETRLRARELADVTRQLNTLQGMIPICANCKSIRNDADEWKQLEEYIQEHSEATFSHGICPDCQKKLYPDLDRHP